MTDHHTLVIPTYNRSALLRRLVRYYRLRAPAQRLLVLDSSRTEVSRENASALSSCGESVQHVVFPPTEPVESKLLRGLEQVRTRYASFCADDDVVFPAGLAEAVSWLESHPDHVSAHGLYLNFREDGRRVHIAREYAGLSIDAAHPGARIFRLLQKYESLFYGVFRTADLQHIFGALPAVSSIHYQELFQSVAALTIGKVHRFPRFFAARQSCPPAEPTRERWQTHCWFAEKPAEFIMHYRPYCQEVWKFYETHAPAPRLDKEQFFKVLDLAHAVFFSAGCPPEYFYSVLQPLWPGDQYERLGVLDTLGEAGRLLALKRLMLPDGAGSADLLEQVRLPASAPRWARTGVVGGVRFLWQSAASYPGILTLNRKAAKAARVPWRCHLPIALRWLASNAQFRATYLELCSYLNGA